MSKLRIILVEDTEITRKVIRKMLEREGFTEVTEAVNGVVALAEMEKAARENRPFEFVLSDWKMPGMSGLELLERIRNHETLSGVPFLLLTSNKDKSSVIEAVQAGVTHYLVKPFPADRLRRKILETWATASKAPQKSA